MTILGHTLPELRKTIAQVVFSVAALAALYIHFNPGLPAAGVAFLVAALGVGAVFQARHQSYSDIAKSLSSLAVATVGVVAFFAHFHPGQAAKIIAIVGALLQAGSVFVVTNK